MKSKRIYLLFLAVLIFVFSNLLLFSPRGANDFPYIFSEQLKTGFSLPLTWITKYSDGLGAVNTPILWSFPIDFIYGMLSWLGFDFAVLELVVGILPILVVGLFSINAFLKHFEFSLKARLVATLFFLTNTYVLSLIDGGQLQIALAYSLFPLVFLKSIQSISESFKSKLVASLLIVGLGFCDIRFVVILAILLLVYFIFNLTRNFKDQAYLWKWIYFGVIAGIVILLANFYWILPLIAHEVAFLPATYLRASQVGFLSFANLGQAFFVQQPHWYRNIFGLTTPLLPAFAGIPLIAYLAIFIKRRDLNVVFWVIISLMGVFLVKGENAPLTQVYPWLFSHIPGWVLFRDPTKFYVLICLADAFLIAVTLDWIVKYFKRFLWLSTILISLIVVYFVLLIYPVYTGKMTGMLNTPVWREQYTKLADILRRDASYSQVLWLPTKSPLGYSSPTHPSLEGLTIYQKRPFLIGVVGSYELFNFIRESNFVSQLMDISSVGYIAYPPLDPRRIDQRDQYSPDLYKYYNQFLDQLSQLPWLSRVTDSPIPLFKTKHNQPKIFVAQNLWWVIGSDDIYEQASQSGTLKNNALVFGQQNPQVGERLTDFRNAKVVLHQTHELDLAASLIDQKELLFPASKLAFDPDSTGWWKRESSDLLNWRDFLQTKYQLDNLDFDLGGGFAVAEGSKQLNVGTGRDYKGSLLLARVMESTRSGQLTFSQKGEQIGTATTKNERPDLVTIKMTGYGRIPDKISTFEKTHFYWKEIGVLTQNSPITIESMGDINVVNSLAVVPQDIWKVKKQFVAALSKEGRIVPFEPSNEDLSAVSFQEINPAKFKVNISGLTHPVMLILAQNYDSGWVIGKTSSLPIYSLLNGYKIEGDGEFILEYYPQRFVVPGLVVSGGAFLLILSLLLWKVRRN